MKESPVRTIDTEKVGIIRDWARHSSEKAESTHASSIEATESSRSITQTLLGIVESIALSKNAISIKVTEQLNKLFLTSAQLTCDMGIHSERLAHHSADSQEFLDRLTEDTDFKEEEVDSKEVIH